MTGSGRGTLNELVYTAIRDGILSGRIRPGQRLKVSDLSAQHQVSLNVVREALNRLTGEQLVRAAPQVGFTVTALSLEDLADLVEVRIAVEGLALRWAIERGNMAWESEVLAAHYRLANTPMISDGESPVLTDEWNYAHAEFHAAVLSACDSPRMREITRSLSDAAEIYRRWSLPLTHARRDLAAEHAELLHATLTHDAPRAVAALTSHLEMTRDALLENFASGERENNEISPLRDGSGPMSQNHHPGSGSAQSEAVKQPRSRR
jgi:GntR family transcriptional regulator, carbon starvation induced regulator